MSTISSIPGAAAQLAARGVSYAPQIAAAAAKHHVDPQLLAAVAAQETGGPGSNAGRNILGDGGHGHGLFQIDDRWHAFARTAAAMDPAKNADYAATMLSGLLDRYGGNVRQALSAYNAGSPNARGTVTTWRNGHALGYADSVMQHYSE
ncbi:MAG: transglycosylase SLT domain-containing protein, partial [Rhodanobacteraceae bacterium]